MDQARPRYGDHRAGPGASGSTSRGHANHRPSPVDRSFGSSVLQRSNTNGHRVWKRHPPGGLIGLGTSPFRIIGVRAAPGSGTGTAEPTWFSLPTKISKTTPCKVAWCRWHGCFERILRKHFDTSGKSAALLHHRAIKRPWPCPTGSSARLQAKSLPTIEVAAARYRE